MDSVVYNTKYGNFIIGYEDDTIVYIKKFKDSMVANNKKTKLTDEVIKQLNEYFEGKRKEFDFKYKLVGTDFQIKVWKELEKIPYGETRSYLDIAKAIGNSKASRAVGGANNKNPISIVVPCHRVIGSNKKLVGYASGLEMKESLLKMEESNCE